MKYLHGDPYHKLRALRFRSWRSRIALGCGLIVVVVAGILLATHHAQPKPVADKKPAHTQKKTTAAKQKTQPAPVVATPTAPAPAPVAVKTYTYCTNVDGVDASNLPEFSTKVASVYADSRGWSLGGKVGFTKVDSGCDIKVWLAAADRVPSYGAICDSTWSCTVHPNVIINFDRWSGASDAWNSAGGSLDDYRSMVINHETGHWFGFQHKYCSGAGQPAPVMQQQSISLQGCAMNSWPLDSEKAQLTSSLGL
ncbi:MAG TPA: DUF3152 domain-containing protein [Candidatus Saccharimonadales bacterium]